MVNPSDDGLQQIRSGVESDPPAVVAAPCRAGARGRCACWG